MKTGTVIKSLLSKKEMTIKQLSEKSGIPLNTLYSITKRDTDNIRSDNLMKILSALGLSISDFYQESATIARDTLLSTRFDEQRGKNNHVRIQEYRSQLESAVRSTNDSLIKDHMFGSDRTGVIEQKLQEDEYDLLQYYSQLNESGKFEALQRVMELGMIDKYKLKD